MNAPSTDAHANHFAGMLVRETAHAIGTAKTTHSAAVQSPRIQELKIA